MIIQVLAKRLAHLKSNLRITRTLRLVWSLTRGWMALVLFMIILETALFLGSLYALKGLIDVVANSGGNPSEYADSIMRQVLLAGAMAILYNIAKAISAYTSEIQAAKVAEHLNDRIHEKAVELELSFYEFPQYFDILQRAKESGSEHPNAVIMAILDTLKSLLSLLAVTSILVSIDWLLLPIMACFVLPTLIVRVFYSDKLNALRLKNTPIERETNYYSQLITSESSAKEIRSYNLGNYFKQQYIDIRLRLMNERFKISFHRTKSEVMTAALASAGFFACIIYIVRGTFEGAVSAGDITIFLVIFPQVFTLLQGISWGIAVIYQHNIYVNSIFELLDLKGKFRESESPKPVPKADALTLEFRNVYFSYPFDDKPTLHDINMSITQGRIVAVVGANGAGKSTLIKLISRLYDPDSGAITLQGIDVKDLASKDYRKQISTVFQDFCKYNVSVAKNIFLGNIDKDNHHEKDIEVAARQSGAHDFIKDFPEGYDTMMGRIFENGHEVSIGQWQKLATARALYSASRFLILDEATSALDSKSESGLFTSLRSYIGNRGALVISHRYSTVKHADYIYVLSDGTVVEEGAPDALVALNGHFVNLFRTELVHESSC